MLRQSRAVYTPRSVRRQGIRDGRGWRWRFWPPAWPFQEAKAEVPPATQVEPATFEVALKEAADADLHRLGEDWQARDGRLKPRYCGAVAERDAAAAAYARETAEAGVAETTFKDAEQKFYALPAPSLDRRWMIFWLGVIGITEFPLNAIVFEIFGEEKLQTYVIAAGLGIVLPILAERFAETLKQPNHGLKERILLVLHPLVALGLIGTVSALRADFFEASGIAEVLNINMSPEKATLLFALINVAMFFAAVMVGYAGSLPDMARYRTLRARLREARRALRRESDQARAAAERLEAGERRYQRVRTCREKEFQRAAERAKAFKENADWFISAYRTANVGARKSASPPCFRAAPLEAIIPESLKESALDWHCDQDLEGGAARREPDEVESLGARTGSAGRPRRV